MTARWVRTVFVALIVAGVAAPALAENWLCEFFEGVVRDTKRRQCWPKPFNCPDREAVRAPFAVMVANGWQRQNMLADFHFEPGTTRLTEAGRLKVRSILFDSPEQHRTVFVRRADTPEETAARIESVQQLVVTMAPPGQAPSVMPTDMSAGGLVGRAGRDDRPRVQQGHAQARLAAAGVGFQLVRRETSVDQLSIAGRPFQADVDGPQGPSAFLALPCR